MLAIFVGTLCHHEQPYGRFRGNDERDSEKLKSACPVCNQVQGWTFVRYEAEKTEAAVLATAATSTVVRGQRTRREASQRAKIQGKHF